MVGGIKDDPRVAPRIVHSENIISIHAEATPHIHGALQKIRAAGVKPSVVINPGTPVEAVKNVLNLVDQVLVMTVNPGFGGQAFLP